MNALQVNLLRPKNHFDLKNIFTFAFTKNSYCLKPDFLIP